MECSVREVVGVSEEGGSVWEGGRGLETRELERGGLEAASLKRSHWSPLGRHEVEQPPSLHILQQQEDAVVRSLVMVQQLHHVWALMLHGRYIHTYAQTHSLVEILGYSGLQN